MSKDIREQIEEEVNRTYRLMSATESVKAEVEAYVRARFAEYGGEVKTISIREEEIDGDAHLVVTADVMLPPESVEVEAKIVP